MTALAAAIAARIARDGPISVEGFMRACLADPQHGYYAGARIAARIGGEGDFITAPEISQVFGELIGLWAAETWRQLGAPPTLRLVELGPGRGTLMADALRAIGAVAPAFRAALRVHLVEISPVLRAAQARALAAAEPAWHDSFDQVPRGPLIVVANEFFDALPVRQFVRDGAAWREPVVALAEGRLALAPGPVVEDPPLEPAHRDAPDGAIVEVCADGRAIAAALGARVARDGGAALLIDYGPAESAPGDSLQALRRHRHVDALAAPGEADVTAHVDFAALARAAGGTGAVVCGPIPQGTFLTRLGIVARTAALVARAAPEQRRLLATGTQRLIDPAHMGTLFKTLALIAPGVGAPPGFDDPAEGRA